VGPRVSLDVLENRETRYLSQKSTPDISACNLVAIQTTLIRLPT